MITFFIILAVSLLITMLAVKLVCLLPKWVSDKKWKMAALAIVWYFFCFILTVVFFILVYVLIEKTGAVQFNRPSVIVTIIIQKSFITAFCGVFYFYQRLAKSVSLPQNSSNVQQMKED